jgi:magnesium transporter
MKKDPILLEIIKPVHVVLQEHHTIKEALQQLRTSYTDEKIIYFYVINEKGTLVGVVSTRSLLLSSLETPIEKIMDRKIVSLLDSQTKREALDVFATSNLLAIPVVDNHGRFLGIVDVSMYVEESFDVAKQQHRLEIFQMIGLTIEESQSFSLWRDYFRRMPWIFCNIVSGIICAWIAAKNEAVLCEVFLLAMFIPLVLTLSESISMQSMTQSLQTLRNIRSPWARIYKEMKTVTLMAFSCGLFVFLFTFLWKGAFWPPFSIGLGIFISVVFSAFLGGIFPLLLHKFRLDPKVSSGPIILMGADILTTSLYFGLSTWLLL